MVSGSVRPIWRRAAAANIHASGDSVGIRGIAPRIEDKIGDTTLLTTAVMGVAFVCGALSRDVVVMSAVTATEAALATGAVESAAVVGDLTTAAVTVVVCATVWLAGGAALVLLRKRLSLADFCVFLVEPPELDTVTPGATSTVDEEDDFSSGSLSVGSASGSDGVASAPALPGVTAGPCALSVSASVASVFAESPEAEVVSVGVAQAI